MGKPAPVLHRRALHQLPDRGRGRGADPCLLREELRPPGRNQGEVRPGELVPDESKHLAFGIARHPCHRPDGGDNCLATAHQARLGRSRSTVRPEIPRTSGLRRRKAVALTCASTVDPLSSRRSRMAESVTAATRAAAPTFKSIRRIPQRPSRPTRITRAVQRFRALVLAFLPPSLPRVTAEGGISSSNSSPGIGRGPCERPGSGADATRTWTPASGTATSTGARGNTEPTRWQRHRVVLGGSRWTRLRAILVPLVVSVVCPPLRPPVFPRTNAAPSTPSALRIRRRPLPGSIPMCRAAARRLPVRSTSLKR